MVHECNQRNLNDIYSEIINWQGSQRQSFLLHAGAMSSFRRAVFPYVDAPVSPVSLSVTTPEWNEASARAAPHDLAEGTQSKTFGSATNATIHTSTASARAVRSRRRTRGWHQDRSRRGRERERNGLIGRECFWRWDCSVATLGTTAAIPHATPLNLTGRLSNACKTCTVHSSEEGTIIEAETRTLGCRLYLSCEKDSRENY